MQGAGFGAYGKIPSIGDFFRLEVPAGFVTVWDNWLQRCLVSGTHTYGAGWDALYMSVPIWRFCLSAGVAGPAAVIGVLMPSVDRVGRRFPLTLMAPLSAGGSLVQDHFLNNDLFQALEDVALAALDDGASRENLSAALAALPVPVQGTAVQIANGSREIALKNGRSETELLIALAGQCATAHLAAPSLWSADFAGDQRLMICEGLPEGAKMQGLFDFQAPIWAEGAA
ncbi:MAG: type VI secretion system protein ImpM [Sulfitobacter sp.]|jgi:type VI secretion system protein ImpM